jgi:hypothetical protein
VIADPASLALEGNLTVSRLDDGFPPTFWPVSNSYDYPRSIDEPFGAWEGSKGGGVEIPVGDMA